MGLIKRINNILDKIVSDILPIIWGVCIVITITALAFGATYWSVTWFLSLLGVI